VIDSAGNNASVTTTFKVKWSSKEAQRDFLLRVILLDLFLNTIYEDWLNEEQKHIISDPLWKFIFGPINFTIFLFLDRITNILPGNLKTFVMNLYNIIWNLLENKFPKPEKTENNQLPEEIHKNITTKTNQQRINKNLVRTRIYDIHIV
jgi:hypothetical protein